MKLSQVPAKFPIPFANNAGGSYTWNIPQASQIGITDGRASLYDGFPPLNFIPIGAGGVPPFGRDFNGLLNQVTAWNQWNSAGGLTTFDAAFSTAIGGYPTGALLMMLSGAGLWMSTADDNIANPDTGGANWVAFYPGNLQKLAANADRYVNPSTGSDSYDGLSATVTGGHGPWATLQHAWDTIQNTINVAGFTVNVHCADGTYNSGVAASGAVAGGRGGAAVIFMFNAVTPSNATVNASSHCFLAQAGAMMHVQGGTLISANGSALRAENSSLILFDSNAFGACLNGSHLQGVDYGIVQATGNYSIVGGAQRHFMGDTGNVQATSRTVTLSGTPAFSLAFAYAQNNATLNVGGITFAGAATGPRYLSDALSVILTQSSGSPTYFPGNSGGTTTNGGIYL